MFKAFSKLIFLKILGWKIVGGFPDKPKYIIIVAPHTSNWDFLTGVFVRAIVPEIKAAKYLGKKSLFKPPLGWLFKAMGGYPVDRTKSKNQVDAVVDIFDKHEEFVIAMAPEGTRSKVEKLKSGFYYIALKANIPIVMVAFDYGKKQVVVNQPEFYPTGDFESDIEQILSFYRGIKGKNPELGI